MAQLMQSMSHAMSKHNLSFSDMLLVFVKGNTGSLGQRRCLKVFLID